MRPRQWVKNGLVLAAPVAAGAIFDRNVLVPTALAFVLFCLASAGVYVINDIHDIEEDRRHPRKRFRPIPAGVVPIPLAIAMGTALLVVAMGGAVLLSRHALAAVIGSYVVVSLCYSFFLKNQPVIDLAVVASGFLLRGIAGGVAAGLHLSQWFLLVAAFGSLFMVAGKRYSELVLMGDEAATRRTLTEYSASYLRFVWSMSAGVACTAYSLWAFELGAQRSGVAWATVSIAPFVLGVLRYAVDIDKGAAGEPEEIVLRDRVLMAIGAVWALTVGLEVFTR
jgi:decaprenyl-phosphate phosphoribosyltransferase